MVRAIDVADFFIDRMKNTDKPMTDFLVNGFLYLSQGYCLARHGTTLFDDDIIAEKQGPVVEGIHNRSRSCETDSIWSSSKGCSLDLFTSEHITLLNDIMMEYEHISTPDFIDIICTPDGPWGKTRSKDTDRIIKKNDLRSWFEKMTLPNSILEILLERKTAGYRDSEGYLVLPKDYR